MDLKADVTAWITDIQIGMQERNKADNTGEQRNEHLEVRQIRVQKDRQTVLKTEIIVIIVLFSTTF